MSSSSNGNSDSRKVEVNRNPYSMVERKPLDYNNPTGLAEIQEYESAIGASNRYLPQMDSNNSNYYGIAESPTKLKSNYGFATFYSNSKASRGGLLTMKAKANDEDIEASDEKPAEDKKGGLYPWIVLAIMLSIRVAYQWQRSLFSYCYGYTGLGAAANNAIFEITASYPQLTSYYGLLTGFAYTIPFAACGIYFGKIVNKVNRKWLLGLMMLASGVQMGLSGFVNSFALLAAMRVVGGFISSAFNPLSFSLIAEYFPPERRTTANSIIQSGNYIGWGLSSLSVIAISKFGWRSTYGILGAISGLIGLGTIAFVKEPIKKVVDAIKDNKAKADAAAAAKDAFYSEEELADMKEKPFKYLLSNPVNRWVMAGAFMRNVGGSVITYYLPVFFLKNFAAFKSQYSAVNGLILSSCGLASSLIAGIVADKYESKNKMTKAYICMLNFFALPLYALGTLQTSNFWLSLACHALATLLTAAFSGSCITMMQNSSPKEMQGSLISTYFANITFA